MRNVIANRICTLNGKQIAYHTETVFLIQTRRNKNKWKTRYSVVGNLGQALTYYQGINVDTTNGWRKRLYSQFMNKPVLLEVKP